MKTRTLIALAVASISTVQAVAQVHHPDHKNVRATAATVVTGAATQEIALPKHAVAVFQASKGSSVKGTLQLEETDKGLHVWGEISELTPGEHGFHIHEFGDLRSDDGTATGAHYTSPGHSHGNLNADKGHEGDFGNITADDKGVAKIDLLSHDLKLHYVLGRAFVVHASQDDLKTQPSGNSGARIGVALIGVAKPPEPKK